MSRRRRLALSLVGIVLCLTASSVIACKLPVFRYALERWPVDRYRIVAIIDRNPDQQVLAAVAELELAGLSHANIEIETIDLSKLSEEQLWQVEGFEGDVEAPLLQVFFPRRDRQRKLCWRGELTASAVRNWCDSNLRRQIVADITSGVTAVWILVEGNNTEENGRVAGELKSALDKATASISVPEGVISRQDASHYLQTHPGASMDDVLRCDIPLKIDFALHRLRNDDDNEPAVRAILSGWTGGRDEAHGALVFPVFGRGRMIEPLGAEQFNEESVIAACRYLVGECNCTMKALNPGVDLILNADWQSYLGDSLVIVDRSAITAPEIIAIPEGGERPARTGSIGPGGSGQPTVVTRSRHTTPHGFGRWGFGRWGYGIVALGVVAVSVAAMMTRRRYRSKPTRSVS